MICCICATEVEYVNLVKYFKITNVHCILGKWTIAECKNERIVVKSGIGKAAVYQCLREVIRKYPQIQIVFSVGIAGALSPNLQIGNIVVGNSVIDYTRQYHIKEFKFTHGLQKYFAIRDNIYYGTIISSDIIVQDSSLKRHLYNTYGGMCVEMESAGMIRVCNNKNLKFAAIKIISDFSDKRSILAMVQNQNSVMDVLGAYIKDVINNIEMFR